MKKILRMITRRAAKKGVCSYAIVHARDPGRAGVYAEKLAAILGRPPVYTMSASPVIGVHVGTGLVAIALTYECHNSFLILFVSPLVAWLSLYMLFLFLLALIKKDNSIVDIGGPRIHPGLGCDVLSGTGRNSPTNPGRRTCHDLGLAFDGPYLCPQ